MPGELTGRTELGGKYSERVQIPAKAKFGDFCRQHLATLATPTARAAGG